MSVAKKYARHADRSTLRSVIQFHGAMSLDTTLEKAEAAGVFSPDFDALAAREKKRKYIEDFYQTERDEQGLPVYGPTTKQDDDGLTLYAQRTLWDLDDYKQNVQTRYNNARANIRVAQSLERECVTRFGVRPEVERIEGLDYSDAYDNAA